jgi:hypothetical protein
MRFISLSKKNHFATKVMTNPSMRTATIAEPRCPYPSTPENIAPKLDEEPNLAGQFFLTAPSRNVMRNFRLDRNPPPDPRNLESLVSALFGE